MPRAQTIRFSNTAVLHLITDTAIDAAGYAAAAAAGSGEAISAGGQWCLSFRIANIRQHSLLKPEVSGVSVTSLC
jgi:hypothetical protein